MQTTVPARIGHCKSAPQFFTFDTDCSPLEIRFFDVVEQQTRRLDAVRALADQAIDPGEKRNWNDAARNVQRELRRLTQCDASLARSACLSTVASRCCQRSRAPGRRSPRAPRRAARSGAPPGDGGDGSSSDPDSSSRLLAGGVS